MQIHRLLAGFVGRPVTLLFRLVLVLCALSSDGVKAQTTNAPVSPPPLQYKADWRWVQGAVFVPTSCVNEAQQWDEYDPVINDRELYYGSVYGINCVRVYLHFYVYQKKKEALLKNIEDFLTRADKYGIKVEFVFFDDCWHQPDPAMLSTNYHYPAPIYGVHNSRWLVSPGERARRHYAEYRDQLKAYVQDIVNAHKDDPRIAFWESYNEPNQSVETKLIMRDAYDWIHATGTKIPVTATGGGKFSGDDYSDFKSWHEYGTYSYTGTADSLNTECMNRKGQTVPGIVEHFRGKTGFIMWELGIGRDNCRFSWAQNGKSPATNEPAAPFHGLIYPDGHPWSVEDVKALLGPTRFAEAPLFAVEYFKDADFKDLAKKSVTPMIDFDLGTERGTGSPDASAGVPMENFSIRWTGSIQPPATGTYTFNLNGDGRLKLYVNGQPLIQREITEHKEVAQTIKLTKGQPVPVKIEYVHITGEPSLHLTWSGPGFEKRVLTPIGNAVAGDQ